MTTLLNACILSFIFAGAAAIAAEPQQASVPPESAQAGSDEVQVVDVPGTRNPELRHYRSMVAGLDAFDEYHAMAPAAKQLRFVIHAHDPALAIRGTSLRIVGGDTAIPVPLADDGTFVLPRDEKAYDADADLISNRKSGSFSGWADVRSEGVPAGMRRLGDLRLECRVMVAVAKKEINFAIRALAATVLGFDWCASQKAHFGFRADGPIEGFTLIDGERRVTQQVRHHDDSYEAPIQDPKWSDETLIAFQPSPPASAETYSAQPLFLRASMDKWGTSFPLRQLDATSYTVDITLAKGKHEFKVGSRDFKDLDLGAGVAGSRVAPDEHKLLAWRGRNLSLTVTDGGNYSFRLDVKNPAAPELTVTRRD